MVDCCAIGLWLGACRVVEFADATDHCLLIVDVDQLVLLAGDDERGFRNGGRLGRPGEAGHRGEGGEHVGALVHRQYVKTPPLEKPVA